MKELNIQIPIKIYEYEELTTADRKLIDAACEATQRSYAPYSHFSVGAAALLESGITVTGTNQENAAYPSGLCAERTAIFYAQSQYPDSPILSIAIAAKTDGRLTPTPTYPCGACRQVMIESQNRGKKPVKVIIGSAGKIEVIDSIGYLMPFAFDNLPATDK